MYRRGAITEGQRSPLRCISDRMKYQAVSGGREIVISPAYGYYIPATVVERGERDYEDKKDGLLAVCLSDIFRLWEKRGKDRKNGSGQFLEVSGMDLYGGRTFVP